MIITECRVVEKVYFPLAPSFALGAGSVRLGGHTRAAPDLMDLRLGSQGSLEARLE